MTQSTFTRAIEMAELLPCPHCGMTPAIVEKDTWHSITCPEGSTCRGTKIFVVWPQEQGDESAIEWWNRRALTPPAQPADEVTGMWPAEPTEEMLTAAWDACSALAVSIGDDPNAGPSVIDLRVAYKAMRAAAPVAGKEK